MDEEILGQEEPDEELVQGNQEPNDWDREPFSDAELSEEARARLNA